jgi:hypothetical protein
MKDKILSSVNNPAELERLYQTDQEMFESEFNILLPEIKGLPAAEFWSARLNYSPESDATAGGISYDEVFRRRFNLWFTIIACLIAGFVAKIPQLFSIPPDNFYLNNVSFIVLPLFLAYYLYKNASTIKTILVYLSVILINVVYINLLPGDRKSDTHVLASIHIVLFTWLFWGFAYINNNFKSDYLKLQFIKRNGDIVILSAVILCAGMLLTGLTLGLFSLIKIEIHKFYFDYVVVIGAASAPIVANYMIENSPKLINKVAPFIAKVFTPLVLISITCFLIALIFFSKDPYNNRNELITYNFLLIAILAIIVFSFSGQDIEQKSLYNRILFVLSLEAIIVNCIALSAIIYRLIAFGISPNRLAVLGGNILMFINLIFITVQLWKFIRNKANFEHLNKAIVMVLPYYFGWLILITYIFPFIFWFK